MDFDHFVRSALEERMVFKTIPDKISRSNAVMLGALVHDKLWAKPITNRANRQSNHRFCQRYKMLENLPKSPKWRLVVFLKHCPAILRQTSST